VLNVAFRIFIITVFGSHLANTNWFVFLLILMKVVRWSNMVVNHEFLNAQWTDGMCANLQVVQITSYKGWLPLSFIKCLLSKASLLRTLSLDACSVSQYDRLNELLNFRRASPQVQVLFKVKELYIWLQTSILHSFDVTLYQKFDNIEVLTISNFALGCFETALCPLENSVSHGPLFFFI
jgi:hypothetical protein